MPFLLVVRTERYFRVLSGKLFISMRMKALICWPGVIRMKLGSTSHTTMTNIPPGGVTCCLSRSQKNSPHIFLYKERICLKRTGGLSRPLATFSQGFTR